MLDRMAARVVPPRLLRNPLWLLLPVGLLYGALALLPIGVILRLGLSDGGAPLRTVLQSPLLLRATENTVVISGLTTVVAVLLGALLAVAVWRAGPRLRALLWACILLPFWTGVLIKNFAWASLLQDNGVVNALLLALGVTDHPLTLLHTRFAAIVGSCIVAAPGRPDRCRDEFPPLCATGANGGAGEVRSAVPGRCVGGVRGQP